jgi:hypothetical protein
MSNRNSLRAGLAGVLLLASATSAQAAGPLGLCAPNVPFLWPNAGANIPFNPDQGGLAILDNAAATAAVEDAFQAWQDVPTATATYTNAGPLPVDANVSNFFDFFFTGVADGLSPIVFDDDGTIFEFLFGPDSGILGFAGPDVLVPATCQITEGAAFLNGPVFDTVEGLLDLMVHEFGHYSNLAHTVVNGQIFIGDTTGPTPDNDTFGFPDFPDGVEVIETMYPFLFFGVDQLARTPNLDDVASLSNLYPTANYLATTGTIRGSILARGNEISGINVIARNIANPFGDAVSALSGDYTQGAPATGVYTLNGLTPGATYAVYADVILAGGFSTPPRLVVPGPEEFHNTGDSETDDPLVFDGVTVAAGAPRTGIDIVFNRFLAGTPLPVGDDGAVEVFLPFEFRMCGVRFESVFINANGNVTFGAPSFSFFESEAGFLGGPARIAGLWRDLSPFNLFTGVPQGEVVFTENSHSFSVHWRNVPEFEAEGANSFSITLHRLLSIAEIKSGNMTAVNGLTGISCGGAYTSQFEQESNLSGFLQTRPCGSNTACLPITKPAVYELFEADDHDLDNKKLLGSTLPFFDLFEKNNSISRAKQVSLPFNTQSELKFTEVRPAGGDVDYFKVKNLRAGKTLIVDLLSGQFDSVLGIFDSAGNQLAVDDDGGLGLLSRIEFVIPADGTYFIAVSAFDDFDFTGDGNTDPVFGVGRYVIDARTF